MAQKIRAGKGFTLAETLIAILILSLVTVAGTAAVTAVLSTRNRMIQVANAQMLASTAAEAVADELRFGRGITVAADNLTVSMDSSLYGTGCTLRLSTEDTVTAAGKVVTGGQKVPVNHLVMTDAAGGAREMLSAKVYDDLHFSSLEFTLNAATTTAETSVAVAMTVADTSGHDLWSAEFTVVPLNGASQAA